MKKRTIMLILVLVSMLALPVMIMAEEYGDITCTEKFVPVHKFECRRPDMSLEKVFQTYEQMVSWYVPPNTETYIPEVTYVYSAPTETLSGN